MIITTTYTERKTITTDDAGNVTISTEHAADTLTEYLFNELTRAAQNRAIHDAIEEEERDYYNGNPCQMYFTEREILDAARDLEKSQPLDIAQDYGCSWYGTARGTYWHHAADWQAVTEQQHTGICYSMDICDRWNAYAARIITLQEAYEEAEAMSAELWTVARDMDWKSYDAETDDERERYQAIEATAQNEAEAIDDIAERIENAAEELTEEAARAVGNEIDSLIESERDYYQSAEFWEEWLNDGETRFTRSGARI